MGLRKHNILGITLTLHQFDEPFSQYIFYIESAPLSCDKSQAFYADINQTSIKLPETIHGNLQQLIRRQTFHMDSDFWCICFFLNLEIKSSNGHLRCEISKKKKSIRKIVNFFKMQRCSYTLFGVY